MTKENPPDKIARSGVSMVAVAWFRADEWSELKRLCPDLQDTHEEWLANAEAGIATWGGRPEQIHKIILTVKDLIDFQKATGRKIDSKMRAELAVRLAHQRDGTRH